jgi:hypothetical protein
MARKVRTNDDRDPGEDEPRSDKRGVQAAWTRTGAACLGTDSFPIETNGPPYRRTYRSPRPSQLWLHAARASPVGWTSNWTLTEVEQCHAEEGLPVTLEVIEHARPFDRLVEQQSEENDACRRVASHQGDL